MRKLKKFIPFLLVAALLPGLALAAFTSSAKPYVLRTSGVVRTFLLSDTASTNGNTSGVYITAPQAMYVEMYGGVSGFGGGTLTLTYATDNSTFATLPTAVVSCTADCVRFVSVTDLRSGFYRIERTASAAAYNIAVNIVAVGALDPQ